MSEISTEAYYAFAPWRTTALGPEVADDKEWASPLAWNETVRQTAGDEHRTAHILGLIPEEKRVLVVAVE